MENRCTGDCIKCSFQQQIYCAAQHGHAIMAIMPNIIERLTRIEAAFAAGEGMTFINPLEDKAQESAGAENRAPETITQ